MSFSTDLGQIVPVSIELDPQGFSDWYHEAVELLKRLADQQCEARYQVTLLPYLEQDHLYEKFDMEKGYAGNLPAARTPIKMFLCPAVETAKVDAVTHYVAMSGLDHDSAARPAGAVGNGFMGYDRLTSIAMIKDGTSNTIALMETRTDIGPWARGGTSSLRGLDADDVPRLHGERRMWGSDSRGRNVALVDGSVRFLRASVEPKQLAAAITIAGGEPVNLD